MAELADEPVGETSPRAWQFIFHTVITRLVERFEFSELATSARFRIGRCEPIFHQRARRHAPLLVQIYSVVHVHVMHVCPSTSTCYENLLFRSNLNSTLNMNLLRTPCKSALFKNRFFVETSACSYSTDGCCVDLSIASAYGCYYCSLKIAMSRKAISVMAPKLPWIEAENCLILECFR
ncbi:hypothetical protein Tsp_08458 [Trichinella spiralis]|uniref:hypothetical protein n=1 Tax=Trichinella spiralis TaxID=6334 RepID=UPI0001EFB789|nr:hypothetical protein Tsp_08458 [Trichinella spiralis]